jgi:hypothetical protein
MVYVSKVCAHKFTHATHKKKSPNSAQIRTKSVYINDEIIISRSNQRRLDLHLFHQATVMSNDEYLFMCCYVTRIYVYVRMYNIVYTCIAYAYYANARCKG